MRRCPAAPPILLLLALVSAGAQPPRPVAAKAAAAKSVVASTPVAVRHEALQAVEKSFDKRLESLSLEDPMVLLGNTRAVYLQGYGVVLTSEVNLVNSPGISPFHQTVTPEEKTRLHARKLQRLGKLKDLMKTMLVSAGAELQAVPLNENVVLGVSLFHFYWEDTAGLPSQVVMSATRQQLVNHQNLDFIRVQEF